MSGCLGAQAKAYADDLYIIAPARLAHQGLKNFADAIAADGGNVNYSKTSIFCQAHSDGEFDIQSPRDFPTLNEDWCPQGIKIGKLTENDGYTGDSDCYGIICQGVPIGDDEFIAFSLGKAHEKIKSDSNKITNTLRFSQFAAFVILAKSTSKKANHLLRYCYPAHTEDFAKQVDSLMLEELSNITGQELYFTCSNVT